MSTQNPPMDVTTTSRGSIWLYGAFAAVVGGVVTELFAAAAKAADVPMEAGNGPEEIAIGNFVMATVVWTAVGTVMAAVFAWKAKDPVRSFVTTAVVLATLSLLGPILGAGDATTATIVVLTLSHVIAAAIAIPILARGLAARRDATA